MPNHLLIYVIVALNSLCQAILIWRFKFQTSEKLVFCSLTVAVPLTIAVIMRTIVATGLLHSHVTEQAGIERIVTMAASMLLIGGPWIVTAAAVYYRQKQKQQATLAQQPGE